MAISSLGTLDLGKTINNIVFLDTLYILAKSFKEYKPTLWYKLYISKEDKNGKRKNTHNRWWY